MYRCRTFKKPASAFLNISVYVQQSGSLAVQDPTRLFEYLNDPKRSKCAPGLVKHFVHLTQKLHFLASLTIITGVIVGFVLGFVNPSVREEDRVYKEESKKLLDAKIEAAAAEAAHAMAAKEADEAAATKLKMEEDHKAAEEQEKSSATLAADIMRAAKIKASTAAAKAEDAVVKAENALKSGQAAAVARTAAVAIANALKIEQVAALVAETVEAAEATFHLAKATAHAARKEALDATIKANTAADEEKDSIHAEQLAASAASAALLLRNEELIRARDDAIAKAKPKSQRSRPGC